MPDLDGSIRDPLLVVERHLERHPDLEQHTRRASMLPAVLLGEKPRSSLVCMGGIRSGRTGDDLKRQGHREVVLYWTSYRHYGSETCRSTVNSSLSFATSACSFAWPSPSFLPKENMRDRQHLGFSLPGTWRPCVFRSFRSWRQVRSAAAESSTFDCRMAAVAWQASGRLGPERAPAYKVQERSGTR